MSTIAIPPASSRRAALLRGHALLAASTVGLLLGNLAAEVARGIWNMAARGGNDWIPFASAARLLAQGSRCLYCAAPLAAAEASFLGRPIGGGQGTLPVGTGHYMPFLNPPAAALPIVPLAVLPSAVGFALFAGISLAALAAAYRVLTGPLRCPALPTLLALLALPGTIGLALGQWAALLTLAVVGALWALDRRPFVSGLLLALLLVEPQYVWLVPIALLVCRRWRVLLGLVGGALLIAAVSLALVGPAGMAAWVRISLATSNDQTGMSAGLPDLLAMAFGSWVGAAGMATGGALVIAAAIRHRRRLRAAPELAVAGFVCLSLVLSPHVLAQDFVLVAPALALAARVRPRLATVAGACVSLAFLVDLVQVGGDYTLPAFLALALATGAALAALAGRVPGYHLESAPASSSG